MTGRTLLLLIFSVGVFGQTGDVPQALQPAGNPKLLFTAHANGAQIYTCRAVQDKFQWTLKAPEAELSDSNGHKIGRHFAGPTWEASDGSTVVSKVAATEQAPVADAIPWLLLTAVSHGPTNGRMTSVTAVQRIHTKGGRAPDTGCDSTQNGTDLRVAYSADYRFFGAASR